MSDSGRGIGECAHGMDRSACVKCLRKDMDDLRTRLDHWTKRSDDMATSRAVWVKKAVEAEALISLLMKERQQIFELSSHGKAFSALSESMQAIRGIVEADFAEAVLVHKNQNLPS